MDDSMTTVFQNAQSIFHELPPLEALYKIHEIGEQICPSSSALYTLLKDLQLSKTPRIISYFDLSLVTINSSNEMQALKQKLEKAGYEPRKLFMDIENLVNTPEFMMYAPRLKLPHGQNMRDYYKKIHESGKDSGVATVILDVQHYKVKISSLSFPHRLYSKHIPASRIIHTLFVNGYIGTHEGHVFIRTDAEDPLLISSNITTKHLRVPDSYWINQAKTILNKKGWTEKTISELSIVDFKPYVVNGDKKKISGSHLHHLQIKFMKKLQSKT